MIINYYGTNPTIIIVSTIFIHSFKHWGVELQSNGKCSLAPIYYHISTESYLQPGLSLGSVTPEVKQFFLLFSSSCPAGPSLYEDNKIRREHGRNSDIHWRDTGEASCPKFPQCWRVWLVCHVYIGLRCLWPPAAGTHLCLSPNSTLLEFLTINHRKSFRRLARALSLIFIRVKVPFHC